MSAHTPTPKLVMGEIVCVGPDGEDGIPYDEAVIHLEGDEDSEIRINCPAALRLAPLIVRAVNRDHHFDALVKALEFYANPNNWIDTPSWDGDPECITPNAIPVTREDGHPCDCGDTARAAIALVRNSSDGKSA